MDMITLAMAKAYTDEKVANSGGSSGGSGYTLPVVEIITDADDEIYGEDFVCIIPEELHPVLEEAVAKPLPIVISFTNEYDGEKYGFVLPCVGGKFKGIFDYKKGSYWIVERIGSRWELYLSFVM